jgi:hypothetical protein
MMHELSHPIVYGGKGNADMSHALHGQTQML